MVRRVYPQSDWPESWTYCYVYDLEEIYGQVTNLGYAYAYQNRREHTLRLLRTVLPPGARVLDIAAAQGNFSLALAELGYDVTWNDLREELEGYVRAKHEQGRISYAPGNAFELAFSYPFDAVLITEVIEHVAHPDHFLASVAKLVRPDGYIIMTTPNGAYFRNSLPRFTDCPDPGVFEAMQFKPNSDGHIFLLHTDEIHTFARQVGLKVDELVLFTNSLTNGHIKLGKVLKYLPRKLVDGLESFSQHLPQSMAERVLVQIAVRFQVAAKS